MNAVLRWIHAMRSRPPLPQITDEHRWRGLRAGSDVLFLDFHGVLHPWATDTFECLPHLYQVLDALPHLQVVIASAWYHFAPRRAVLERIAPPYRDRFVDVLPLNVRSPVAREVLLMRYVRTHGVRGFAAVTGHGQRFTARCGWAFLLPAGEGLNDLRARALINFITHRRSRGPRVLQTPSISAPRPWPH